MTNSSCLRQSLPIFLIVLLLIFPGTTSAQTWQQLYEKADSIYKKGNEKEAYIGFLEAEKQAKIEFGIEHINTAKTINILASILLSRGDYDHAAKKFLDARSIFSRVAPTSAQQAEISFYLGQVYRNQSKHSEADSSIREGLRLSGLLPVETDRKEYRAYGLTNLAVLYRVMGDDKRAEPLLIEAIKIQDLLKGKLNTEYASYVGSLAAVYDGLEEYTAAEPLYIEALSIYRHLFGENHPRLTTVLNNLGNYYVTLGNYASAIPLLSKALEIRTKTGTTGQGYAETIQNLASCYKNQNQSDRADSLFGAALNVLEKQVGKVHPMYANTLQNRASLQYQTKKYAEALSLHLEALLLLNVTPQQADEQYARMLYNTATDYLALRELVKADSLTKMALGVTKRRNGENTISYATYLFTQGQAIYQKKSVQEGIKLMEEALKKYNSVFNKNFLSMTPKQKTAFAGRWRSQYERYYSTIMDTRLALRSFDIVLTQKGMLLNEYTQIASALSISNDPLVKDKVDSLLKVKSLVATQYTLPITQRKNLDSLEARSETFEKDLARQSAPFRQAKQALAVRWEDVRDALKPTEAAVEFVSFPYHNGRQETDSVRYMALVLRPGDVAPQVVPLLTDEGPLRRLLARRSASSGAITYATRGSELDTDQLSRGDSLYRLIWQPIDTLLAGAKTVWLAPSGLLHQVSFAALPYPGSVADKTDFKTPHYLADRYQLRQVGSTRQVAAPRTGDDTYQTLSSATLYGGIVYDSTGQQPTRAGAWPYLPGTRREVEQISRFVGPKARAVTGRAATEAGFKAQSGQSPTVLHIATHGFAFPDPLLALTDTSAAPDLVGANPGGATFRRIANPLFRTGLLMAGANHVWQGGRPALGEDDGILTAYEVANLNLSNTKLVVLSACETALGDIRGSEGVFGLQRAFKMAGAGYLLTSLWPVSDEATSDLMTLFYRNWKRHKTIRAAFAQTQLALRKTYPPSVWAAFVLIE
jgi:CHAT domain-containing protein/Tfp pilus assembly protein PilF